MARGFKRYLLSTTQPQAMRLAQLRDLQKHLAVIALSWDGVQKAFKEARAKANG